jgi:glucose uptake protein GlcU
MVGLVALVLIVIGGFRLLIAAGNDNEVQKAKSMITYVVVGLVVALLAYIIVAFVQALLYR